MNMLEIVDCCCAERRGRRYSERCRFVRVTDFGKMKSDHWSATSRNQFRKYSIKWHWWRWLLLNSKDRATKTVWLLADSKSFEMNGNYVRSVFAILNNLTLRVLCYCLTTT